MEITVLPTESAGVRCAICARPARRGATLCAQCKAAVKRARHVQTVRSEFLPHPVAAIDLGPPGFFEPQAPRADRSAASEPGGWGTYATLVAFGVAVCLTGYLALGEIEDASNALHDSLTIPSVPAKRERDAGRGSGSSLASDESDAAAQVDASEAAPGVEPAIRGVTERRSVREPRPLDNGAASRAPDAVSEPMPPEDEGIAMAPAPVPTEVKPAPEPVPDRLQLLATALSTCERENAVVGLFCKERARLQFCDGQWGAVPQCPVGVASGNTR